MDVVPSEVMVRVQLTTVLRNVSYATPCSAFFQSTEGEICTIDARSLNNETDLKRVSFNKTFRIFFGGIEVRVAEETRMCTTAWRVAGRRSTRLAIDRRFLLPFRFVRLGRTSARHGKCAQNRLSPLVEKIIIDTSNFSDIYTSDNHTYIFNLINFISFYSILRVILIIINEIYNIYNL